MDRSGVPVGQPAAPDHANADEVWAMAMRLQRELENAQECLSKVCATTRAILNHPHQATGQVMAYLMAIMDATSSFESATATPFQPASVNNFVPLNPFLLMNNNVGHNGIPNAGMMPVNSVPMQPDQAINPQNSDFDMTDMANALPPM